MEYRVESKEHNNAKLKLYELIKNNKVKIKDHLDNVYNIFIGEYEDEFIELEYPSVFGYTPDICFGYKNKQMLWLEIFHTHECDTNKINSCKMIKAQIIEFTSADILNFTEEDIFITGTLVTSMNKEDYKSHIRKIKSENSKKKRKINAERGNTIIKKKTNIRKSLNLFEHLESNYSWIVDKMKENIINKKYFLKYQMDNYLKKHVTDFECKDDLEKMADKFYRKNGFGVLSAKNYNDEKLRQEGIDYFGNDKIIVLHETSIRLNNKSNI